MTGRADNVDEYVLRVWRLLDQIDARLRPMPPSRLAALRAPIARAARQIRDLTAHVLPDVELPPLDPADHMMADVTTVVAGDLADILAAGGDRERLAQLVEVLDRLAQALRAPAGT